MAHVTVQQALQNVADHPVLETDPIDTPVHELIARALYEIANKPDAKVRGSMARANKARRMIFERLVGRRRAGTRPAVKQEHQVEMIDLTGRAVEGGSMKL